MATKKSKQNSKNNPDKRIQEKQLKRIDSSHCDKCDKQCDEYFRYIERLRHWKVGLGVLCKK